MNTIGIMMVFEMKLKKSNSEVPAPNGSMSESDIVNPLAVPLSSYEIL